MCCDTFLIPVRITLFWQLDWLFLNYLCDLSTPDTVMEIKTNYTMNIDNIKEGKDGEVVCL